MPEWVTWVFSGIGNTIIGLLIGGISGYIIGKRSKIKQIQVAGDSAKQKQISTVDNKNDARDKINKETNSIIQKQKAGNNAEQIQIGGTNHGR